MAPKVGKPSVVMRDPGSVSVSFIRSSWSLSS